MDTDYRLKVNIRIGLNRRNYELLSLWKLEKPPSPSRYPMGVQFDWFFSIWILDSHRSCHLSLISPLTWSAPGFIMSEH